jgi:hypothetical protein
MNWVVSAIVQKDQGVQDQIAANSPSKILQELEGFG